MCVIGGTGFLGSHVVRATRAAGFRVVAIARRPGSAADDTAIRTIDVLNAVDLERALVDLSPVAVVNCAALARIADCARDPSLARRMNAELPRFLARFAAERRVRLVQVSTDLVFGLHAAPRTGFAETDEPAPTSEYGATKLAGERAVTAANPAALVVRLPLLCGDSFGRGLGASDSVLAAVNRGERPRLFTDEWRTPLDASDAARALVELASTNHGGLLHVAGPERMTRFELGLRALRAHGRVDADLCVDAAVREGEHADRPADVALNADRARALLRTPLPVPYVPYGV